MKMMTDEDRARIARGWASSCLDQESYARLHNISARSLRAWCRRYAVRNAGAEQVRAVVVDAQAKLQAILDGLNEMLAKPADLPEDSHPAVAGPSHQVPSSDGVASGGPAEVHYERRRGAFNRAGLIAGFE